MHSEITKAAVTEETIILTVCLRWPNAVPIMRARKKNVFC